jgi:hypothetical protein
LRVVAFCGVFSLNRPDDASCGFLAEERQCRTKTEGAVAVGSSARLCENSDSVILKNEKVVRITFVENKNAP